jgi:hypothetical protein
MTIQDIRTSREVFDSLKTSGFKVSYNRLPISPEQSPEDRYIDDYMAVIQNTKPSDMLVINCGMGLGRSILS